MQGFQEEMPVPALECLYAVRMLGRPFSLETLPYFGRAGPLRGRDPIVQLGENHGKEELDESEVVAVGRVAFAGDFVADILGCSELYIEVCMHGSQRSIPS